MATDNFFDKVRKRALETAEAQRQLRFQERVVKRILKESGIPISVKQATQEAREKYGEPYLSLQWLYDEFPQFPVKIFTSKLRGTHKATLADLYGKGQFKKLPWWKEYQDLVTAEGIDLREDRAVLVFNLPHAKDAFLMTLHNQPTQVDGMFDAELREDPWPRTLFPVGNSGIVAVLEAFPSFMNTIGRRWHE